jgi:uncharacterized coiled-coil protein SlyX
VVDELRLSASEQVIIGLLRTIREQEHEQKMAAEQIALLKQQLKAMEKGEYVVPPNAHCIEEK